MPTSSRRNFPDLTLTNFGQWLETMEAWLKTNELFDYVTGEEVQPPIAIPATPTATELKERKIYRREQDKAAGEILLSITESQRAYVRQHKDDPQKMWEALKEVHLQKKPGNCFNSLESLLSIQLEEGKSLTTLVGRISTARV